MRKVLAFLVLLMLPWAARGQALAEWYYWFDMDEKPHETGTITSQQFQLQTDVSHLDKGFHTLFVQVKDTAGIYSTPYSQMFYNMPASESQSLLFRYWFDNSGGVIEHACEKGQYMLDVSHLTSGFHILNYYLCDKRGSMIDIHSTGFYCVPMPSRQKLYYWLDGDSVATPIPDFWGGFTLDVTKACEGFNTIYFLMDDNGLSNTQSYNFIKIPQTENAGDMTLVCIIDGKIVGEEKVAAHGGVVKCDMDVTNMEVGMHKAMFQLITPSGAGSSIAESYFLRTLTNDDIASMQCTYTIDGFRHYVHKGTCANGVFHFDLPVEDVEDGLHRIDFMLVAENGATTTQGNAWFFKTPVGGNGITQYDYWLNDKSDDVQSVTLDEPKDPFQLIKLLPVTAEPIRSSCFHFEAKDGKPMLYAKNDIHFRFHDKSGRWVDADNQYVDYNVSRPVEGIKPIDTDMGTEHLTKPDDNSIAWYSMACEKGDSISFKLSQPATLQMFSALGEELLSTSGSESVKMSGARIKKNGTYYVAIHDVTGSGSMMTMDYLKVGKFTLLSSSKLSLGVLPAVQILSLEGNGFDNLQNVSMKLGDKILTADSIAHLTNQTARLYWLFNGNEPLGNYDLSLHFDDGEEQRDIVKSRFVTLEMPSFDDIVVDVSDPRRVADPYPVYIKVTNNSNIAYQAIPFYFAIDNVDKMQSVKYMDFAVGCSKELYDAGLKLNFEYDSFKDTNSKTRVVPTIIPELLPGETKTYTLGVKTGNHQIFNVYAWTGRPWNLLAQETKEYIIANYSNIQKARSMKKAPGIAGIFDGCSDDPCDLAGVLENQLAECACGTSLGLGGTLGGIQNALQNQHNRAMRDQLAQSGLFDDPYEYFPDQYLPSPEDLLWYWLQHCIPGRAGQATSLYNAQRQMLGNNPCQNPQPHPCNPYNPGDPNEIHGIVSESGSKYIRQDITDITYSIEFENDPELANASAHKIFVCDTLDTNIFDMSSFMTTSIKLGNKSVDLDDRHNSVQTLDMRPEINAIAQVETEFNQNTGVAKWTISSLDPMTMEETFDIMQGILPVNRDGNGVGFINYEVGQKKRQDDGASFSNRASIIFDFENPILTPVWTNIVDAVCPSSRISNLELVNDTTVQLNFDGYDERSGVWKYELYVQDGENAPWRKEAEMDSTSYDFRFYEDIDYGFYVVATDSAGNVEPKVIQRERGFKSYGDGDDDDSITPIQGDDVSDDATYDIAGRKVGRKGYRGIVIRNRRKLLLTKD